MGYVSFQHTLYHANAHNKGEEGKDMMKPLSIFISFYFTKDPGFDLCVNFCLPRSWENLYRLWKSTGKPTRTTPMPANRWSPYDRTSRLVIFINVSFVPLSFYFSLGLSLFSKCLFLLLSLSRSKESVLISQWKCTSVMHASLWKRWVRFPLLQ